MSLISNISMLGQALRNFQYGVTVNANNVANANTLGYSRELINFSENSPLRMDGFTLGSGAFVSSIDRARNVYLDRQIRTQLTTLGFYSTRSVFDSQFAAIFPDVAGVSPAGFTTAINTLSSAWTALASATGAAIPAAQTAVRDAGQALATLFNTTSQQLNTLQTDLDSQISTTVDRVNSYLDQINTLNLQIKASTVGTFLPGGLMDAREQAMQGLARLVNVQFAQDGNGSVTVNLSGGGSLLDNGKVNHLKMITSATHPGVSDIGFTSEWGSTQYTVNKFITSGSLGALLQERDVDLRQARLTLDSMASGYIQRTNDINHSAVASSDSTTGHNFFSGSKASDMRVDALLFTRPDYVGQTRDTAAPGDVATMQAAQKNFMLSSLICSPVNTVAYPAMPPNGIEPTPFGPRVSATVALSAQGFNIAPAASGLMHLTSGGTTVNLAWTSGQTINAILKGINDAGAGDIYATFDYNDQRVMIMSRNPLTVWDETGNLSQTFKLGALLTSAAPVNDSPSVGLNQVSSGSLVNSATSLLNYYTEAKTSGGVFTVAGTNYTWASTQSLLTMTNNMTFLAPAGLKVFGTFSSTTQLLSLYQPRGFSGNTVTSLTSPLTSLSVNDASGNFTSFTNLRSYQSFNGTYNSLMTVAADRSTNDGVFSAQAQSAVDGLQAVQDSIATVSLAQEAAQAAAYQRSYEASVRIQTIMDQMLNVLINHMGSSAPAGDTVL